MDKSRDREIEGEGEREGGSREGLLYSHSDCARL
jgi:hypothetical protein